MKGALSAGTMKAIAILGWADVNWKSLALEKSKQYLNIVI